MNFEGTYVAMITPFDNKGDIDEEGFRSNINYLIDKGVNGLVGAGTTGESATITHDEHKQIIEVLVDEVDGRVETIAGTGSNSTSEALNLTKFAQDIGVDAALVITPYYNKPQQHALVNHYRAVGTCDIPVIAYNVPSRTGVDIAPSTYAALADHPMIGAIKEASGNISQIAKVAELCGDKMDIYSGNDDQIVPVLSLGGKGVISVLSNLVPKETSDMCHLFWEGKTKESLELQLKYLSLVDALFSEVNPIPAKAAMAAMGYCENALRLPLTPMESKNEEKLLAIMRKVGILEG